MPGFKGAREICVPIVLTINIDLSLSRNPLLIFQTWELLFLCAFFWLCRFLVIGSLFFGFIFGFIFIFFGLRDGPFDSDYLGKFLFKLWEFVSLYWTCNSIFKTGPTVSLFEYLKVLFSSLFLGPAPDAVFFAFLALLSGEFAITLGSAVANGAFRLVPLGGIMTTNHFQSVEGILEKIEFYGLS
jgi:hypothetical protein